MPHHVDKAFNLTKRSFLGQLHFRYSIARVLDGVGRRVLSSTVFVGNPACHESHNVDLKTSFCSNLH